MRLQFCEFLRFIAAALLDSFIFDYVTVFDIRLSGIH